MRLRLLAEEFDEAGGVVDFAPRLGEGLALLARHDERDILAIGDDEVEPAPQDFRPLFGQRFRPRAEGFSAASIAPHRLGVAETIGAIEAAQRAFSPWAKTLPKERAQILRRWFDLMIANREDIALIMTSEQGKPLAEARGEVDYAAGFIEFFGEEAKRIYGEINPTFRANSRIVVLKQPIGVVAAITPWNFPCGDDHPQGGAGARCRLHRGREARARDTADRARARANWRCAPACRRASSTS